jgi:hypothetical protein
VKDYGFQDLISSSLLGRKLTVFGAMPQTIWKHPASFSILKRHGFPVQT